MRHLSLFIILVTFWLPLIGQNILINGSFEETHGSVRNNLDPTECKGWDIPYDGQTFKGLYFNPPTGLAAPFDLYFNMPLAYDGDAYTGFFGHGYQQQNWGVNHQYLTGLFSTPMITGTLYKVSFVTFVYGEGSTDKQDRTRYCDTSNALGVHFSNDYDMDDPSAQTFSGPDILEGGIFLEPDWQSDVIYAGRWVEKSFYYRADDNYSLITFGNFQKTSETYCDQQPPTSKAMNFIDDVIVEPVDIGIEGPTVLCSNEVGTLEAIVNPGIDLNSINWYSSDFPNTVIATGATLSVNPQDDTEYYARLNGLEASHDLDVLIFNNYEETIEICSGEVVTLEPDVPSTPGVVFNWEDDSDRFFKITGEAGVYTATVTYESCVATHTYKVTVKTECECGEIRVRFPTAISPNGNGVNDSLVPLDGCGLSIADYTMKIYNRWGNHIADSDFSDGGWRGETTEGQVDPGLYLYRAEVTLINSEETLSFSGTVQLLY